MNGHKKCGLSNRVFRGSSYSAPMVEPANLRANNHNGDPTRTEATNISSRPTLILNPYAYVPEGLEIGSTVSYNPSGTYNVEAQYSGYDTDQSLNSATGQNYNLNTWKVLSIDQNTGQVELVPSAPTTGTVYLRGANGYNNAVKLLNDACNSLYGSEEKGIGARSINRDDIENYMTGTALATAHSYSSSMGTYGQQESSVYSERNKHYPSIYAQEKNSVINGITTTSGLGISEQTKIVYPTDNGATNGYIQGTSQPYNTYWYMANNSLQTAFEITETGINYYNLLIPSQTSTSYWLASRCINTYMTGYPFSVCFVHSGNVTATSMFGGTSEGSLYLTSRALFPVVSLNVNLITGDSSTGFSVQ